MAQLQEYAEAIAAFENALSLNQDSPNSWSIFELLARLYYFDGDLQNALLSAQKAYSLAPEEEKENIEQLMNQLSK